MDTMTDNNEITKTYSAYDPLSFPDFVRSELESLIEGRCLSHAELGSDLLSAEKFFLRFEGAELGARLVERLVSSITLHVDLTGLNIERMPTPPTVAALTDFKYSAEETLDSIRCLEQAMAYATDEEREALSSAIVEACVSVSELADALSKVDEIDPGYWSDDHDRMDAFLRIERSRDDLRGAPSSASRFMDDLKGRYVHAERRTAAVQIWIDTVFGWCTDIMNDMLDAGATLAANGTRPFITFTPPAYRSTDFLIPDILSTESGEGLDKFYGAHELTRVKKAKMALQFMGTGPEIKKESNHA